MGGSERALVERTKRISWVVTLVLYIGVIPFLNCAHASASTDTCATTGASRWLDDYKAHVGLTYGASATLNTNYLWRGLYVGGLNLQPEANVGYGGLYVSMWWSIGATNWAFARFQPEVDVTIGFARWGLNVSITEIHNFNCGFFDYTNYPGGGNGLELGLRYTVSSKLPLSFFWATRVAAADGYMGTAGDTIRAYSTYIELSYTHHFPYGIDLGGAVGVTPWRSLYTGYQRDFAVQNIALRLSKDWSLSAHCGLKLQGLLGLNPSAIAADKSSAEWHPAAPENQSINANIGVCVYLK